MNYYVELGEKIRKARKDAKMSQKELADAMNKNSATYIALLESGKRKVSIRDLISISGCLEKPLHYFLGNDFESLEPRAIIKLGLRADPNLDRTQKKMLLDFYDFLCSKNDLLD